MRAADEPHIRLNGTFIGVLTPRPSNRRAVEEQVTAWIMKRARATIARRVEANLSRFAHPEAVRPSGITIRRLKQRWGSMSPTGRLIINRDLMQAAPHEIDFVITHELSHRVFHHHGPEFFDLLTRVMPDWQKRKASLERRLA